ncbi:hypothetical protein Tco_0514673 [Tanacetum coccineum]
MVACLEKSEENVKFHQIVDFLSTCSINYALTVNPTIYTSYIEQFLNTATSKTVNSVKQIHVIVDNKVVVTSESSVRSDLLFNDEDGITCLTNDEIFENLTLMGYEQLSTKLTFQKEPTLNLKHSTNIFLYVNLKLTFEQILQSQLQAPEGEGSAVHPEPQPTPSTSQPNVLEPQTKSLQTATPPNATPQIEAPQTAGMYTSGSPRRQETIPTQTRAQTRSERVLAQPKNHLSQKVTHLEVGKVLDLEKEKDAQAVEILNLKKRGRRSDKLKPMFKDKDFEELDDQMENVEEETVDAAATGVSTVSAPISTAGVTISTAESRTPPTTTTVFDDEDVTMAMAQTLIKMKEQKAKEKGVDIIDVEDSSNTIRHVRSITTLQPLPTIDPKDKDAELAQRLHEEELAELERRQKERVAQKASIDADALFAAKLQQEEREQFTIEERAQFLVETIAAQRKFRAAQRVAEIRSKPPTKTQMRNLMMTYLKNMGGYKHSQLKGKTYEEIHRLYERQQKRDQDFIPMDSEKEAQKSSKRLKRVAGSYTTQKSPKKPKVMKSAKDATEEEAAEYEKEKEELRLSLKIIPNDDSEVKADGSSSFHGDIHAFFRRLDRQDLNDLYRLVQERFQDHPLEGQDLLLLGDLRMIFDPNEEDELWMNQLDWKLLRWKLYENCGVHTLFLDGKPMKINMLVEKKYPLIKELIEKMLNLQLEAEEESTIAFKLIKFIKSLLKE